MAGSLPYRKRIALERERRKRRKVRIEGVKGDASPLPDETFLEWCERLAVGGMKIDGKPFSLADRPALLPLYRAIPSTREQAQGLVIIVQKATQLGLTVWEVLANIYLGLKFAPVNVGMFLPDQATASFKSEHRFMRIVRSVPQLAERLTHRFDVEGQKTKVGEGNILTRAMGESIFMFLWTSGKVSTESRPMDVVTLDEVQEMDLAAIDKVHARVGDSDIGMSLLLSTANMPDLDINYWYLLGNQMVWHTACPSCGELSDLSDPAGVFPEKSIAFNAGEIPGAPTGEYVWTCPACRGWIQDPQIGQPVEKNPGADPRMLSFMLPRTISPKESARKMFLAWSRAKTGDQKKSFYNRRLARPYIDASQLPVSLADCLACVEAGKKAGVVWRTSGRDTFMGIDQMGGFNAVIIKERLPDGRQATIHVEAIFDLDPFARCTVLMKSFGVQMCVVEQLPNVNDARRFVNAHPGRAFLAGYADLKTDMIVWGDALSRSDQKTIEEDRSRYSVTLSQYKCMQSSLFRIRDRVCLFPDPDGLEQDVIDDGVSKRIPILRDWVFLHLTKTALVVEEDEETRKLKPKVKKVGIDPHYAFANMLCDVAWARSYGTSTFFFPEAKVATQSDRAALPDSVAAMLDANAQAILDRDVCGRCVSFEPETGRCLERSFIVRAVDPGCELFIPTEDVDEG